MAKFDEIGKKLYVNKDGSDPAVPNAAMSKVSAFEQREIIERINDLSAIIKQGYYLSKANPTKQYGLTDGVFAEVVGGSPVGNILFSDNFTGTVIDSTKWTILSPNTDKVELSQNDELIVDYKAPFAGIHTHTLMSKTPLTLVKELVYSVDIIDSRSSPNSNYFGAGFTGDATVGVDYNNIMVMANANSQPANEIVRPHIKINGTANSPNVAAPTSIYTTFRVVVDLVNISIEYWNVTTEEWVVLNTTTNNWIKDHYTPMITTHINTSDVVSQVKFDNLTVTDYKYNTRRP